MKPKLQLRAEDLKGDWNAEKLERLIRPLNSFGVAVEQMAGRSLVLGQTLAIKEVTVQLSDWTALTLQNSWVAYGGGFPSAGYTVDGGRIVLRGLVKSGTIGQAIATLPAGARPAYAHSQPVVSAGAFGFARVESDGRIVAAAGSNTDFCLDGIGFVPASAPPRRGPFPLTLEHGLATPPTFVWCRATDITDSAEAQVSVGVPAWRKNAGAVLIDDIDGLLPLRKYRLTVWVLGI